MAGGRQFDRGQDYYARGHVESLTEQAGAMRAIVRGRHAYNVRLRLSHHGLEYTCDCPLGSEGTFCKHCVAAALAWVNRRIPPAPGLSVRPAEITLEDTAKLLEREDKGVLVRILVDYARDDERLKNRLLQFTARRHGREAGIAAVRRALGKALRVSDYVHYREAEAWVNHVDEAITNIASLLEDGHAAAAAGLCEFALEKLVEAAQSFDDSDGHLSILRDQLEGIHFQACQRARPEPLPLARQLFQWEMRGELDIFRDAAERYAEILGPEGLEEYRRLAEAEWQKVPPRVPGALPDGGEHFHIAHIMESLARASGDIEQLTAVMSRDLSSSYNYLRIAEVYQQAGQPDNALAWAEKGLKAFPERTDSRLRDFAAELYHQRGRHEHAVQLMWAEFSERPFLETYRKLERHARAGSSWPEWRGRALADIRHRISSVNGASPVETNSRLTRNHPDHSPLVQIFLYERDPEAAWREAQTGGCSGSLWLELAAARAEQHPEDAAPIYLSQAEACIIGARNFSYDEAVRLLVKAAAVMKHMNRSDDFVRYLEGLRAKYRIKRNFIKVVDEHRKSLYLS